MTAPFCRAIAPGSYLIISIGSGNKSEQDNFTSAYTAASISIHSTEEIGSFFHDLELLPPGVVQVPRWTGQPEAADVALRTATFIGGVARKA